MTTSKNFLFILSGLALIVTTAWVPIRQNNSGLASLKTSKYLYVVVPGIRDYLEYGGHGILVYDIEDQYKLIKRIPCPPYSR